MGTPSWCRRCHAVLFRLPWFGNCSVNVSKRLYPLYIHIVTIFLLMALTLSGLMIYRIYLEGSEMAMHASSRLFEQLRGKVTERINRIYDPVVSMVALTTTLGEVAQPITDQRTHPLFDFFVTALDRHRNLYALYLGFENGDFFEVARLDDKVEMKQALGAPDGTHYGVMTIIRREHGARGQVWSFLDRDRKPLGKMAMERVDYDPRVRPWYRLGIGTDAVVRTKPYVFAKLGQPGITFAHRFQGASRGVFGADISLSTLSRFLAEQQFTPSSTVLFFDADGTVIGYPDMDRLIKRTHDPVSGAIVADFAKIDDLEQPALTALFQFFENLESTGIRTFPVAGRSHIGAVAHMPLTPNGDSFLGIVAPLDEILGPIYHMGHKNLLSAGLIMLLAVPVIWWASRRVSRPLGKLTEEIAKVETMALNTVGDVPTQVREIRQLSHSFKRMIVSLKDYDRRLTHTQSRLFLLVEIGLSLGKERQYDRLLETILVEGKRLTYADAGTLFLKGEDDQLHVKIISNTSLGLACGGASQEPITCAPTPLAADPDGRRHRYHAAAYAAQTGKTVRVDNAYAEGYTDFPGMREMDRQTGYRSISLLAVPIKTQRGEILGVLQLVNTHDPQTRQIIPFDRDTVGFVEALTAQAATAMENQHLIEEQKRLFNAFIQMIATAIDTKSPYTGGHCARVPILAKMLAEAASESDQGVFSDFFLTDEDRHALHLASWLHDCGKIATPEFVVDKATKLETIYNRIHEIRARFEILCRDAEIRYLKGVAERREDAELLAQQWKREVASLEEDFAFIAECNVGSEFLTEEKKVRIRTIAGRVWSRHFDDRLGLSHIELDRYEGQPAPALPVQESLLADKEVHRFKRETLHKDRSQQLDAFNVDVPVLHRHLGEIHNLCIERGTLTAEERYQIVEHIILTIRMLEKLPFPKAIHMVSEFAGGHHETMIGTGYPRKLTRDQMSVPARVMAIADIFEALTASDRPYKKAKTLSEAIRIMGFMAKDQHIDGDLFQLFLDKKLYLKYANVCLNPDQIDDVVV